MITLQQNPQLRHQFSEVSYKLDVYMNTLRLLKYIIDVF